MRLLTLIANCTIYFIFKFTVLMYVCTSLFYSQILRRRRFVCISVGSGGWWICRSCFNEKEYAYAFSQWFELISL